MKNEKLHQKNKKVAIECVEKLLEDVRGVLDHFNGVNPDVWDRESESNWESMEDNLIILDLYVKDCT